MPRSPKSETEPPGFRFRRLSSRTYLENRDRNKRLSQISPISYSPFPSPFTYFESHHEDGDRALTFVEFRMIELSYALSSKPSWWTKINDPAIRSKWKAEALEQEIRGGVLQDTEIEWVLDELKDYALMRDEETGIQPSCHARSWESDKLVSQDLRARLKLAAATLENVLEEEKDWHPRLRPDPMLEYLPKLKLFEAPDGHYNAWAYSKTFSWIPTDFQLGENGAPAKALGYINNVQPTQHKDLITVIESLVGRFSLLWDQVLTDIHSDNEDCLLPWRVGSYEWNDHSDYPEPPWQEQEPEEVGIEEFNRQWDAWKEHRVITLPTADEGGFPGSDLDLTYRKRGYSVQGRVVQVIVKLTNIHLTPENPEYPGGSWHVEGMANESIVASGIYYYHSENISDSQLASRVAVNFGEASYERGDNEGVRLTLGMTYGQPSNQVVGAVQTSANRCVAFPNIYQHQVSSLKLVDPTKPGHRKIVALFLVDPESRIPSTSDVPHQQSHWTREAIFGALVQHNPKTNVSLPVELADMVMDRVDSVMTSEEAEAYRLELMDERTAFVDVVDEKHFSTAFNFCEH